MIDEIQPTLLPLIGNNKSVGFLLRYITHPANQAVFFINYLRVKSDRSLCLGLYDAFAN